MSVLTDATSALPNTASKEAADGETTDFPLTLAGIVEQRYHNASTARLKNESIWANSFRAYRGDYEADEIKRMDEANARNPGSSRAYIKITKTKVLAAYGQLREILFNDSKFPIGLEPTAVPEGIAETAYIAPEGAPDTSPKDVYGYEGDGKELEKGATGLSLLAGLMSKYSPFTKGNTVKDGPAPDKQKLIQLSPAAEAAKNMEKVIHDQLADSNAAEELDKLALEAVIYGTGVMKGPFNLMDTLHKYSQDPDSKAISYVPEQKLVPKINHVSIWNFYPDPTAESLADAEYIIEKHILGRSKFRDLGKMPKMNKDVINKILKTPAKRVRDTWESTITDTQVLLEDNRYEVLEYWGSCDPEFAREFGLEDETQEFLDSLQVNIWVCQGEILRFVLNPFTPERIPYLAVPYERHPHQIWGVGVPENMRDTQRLMNGHLRMGIDNLRLAGNVILEINDNSMVPGQDMTLYPGKVFRKQVGTQGPSIASINIPNTSQSHMMMFDKARQLADEAVGIPSFSHGQTGVTGTGKTASGMSMLMSAAAGAIKTVVMNFDQYLLEPLGESLFQWNMQFNEENVDIRGDLRIVASGTKSLMQREVLTQRLISFMQVAGGNQATAPLVNFNYALEEIAISMGLDPDKIVNNPQQAAAYADLMSKLNAPTNPAGSEATAPSQPTAPSGPTGGPSGVPDASGGQGGTIGTQAPSMPGEAGFSARLT